jgi:hypothetical protein
MRAKWFVKEIVYGRWDIRETAATISAEDAGIPPFECWN